MQTSTDRILTTHTGSIARPDDLIELMRARENGRPYDREAFEARATAAVEECVRRQVEAGLDVINDGEQRKSGFTTYLKERLAGFEAVPYAAGESPASWPEVAEFPEYYERYFKTAMYGAMLSPPARVVCRGPVTYIGQEALATDLANLRAGLAGKEYTEVFMSAALPTGLADYKNEYYSSREEYVTALADACHEEYRAIIDAGFLIQLDDPAASSLWGYKDAEPAERDRRVAETVELINYTLRDIPPEKIRYHTCYGINQGPHIYDLRLRDFIEPMLHDQRPGVLVRGDEHPAPARLPRLRGRQAARGQGDHPRHAEQRRELGRAPRADRRAHRAVRGTRRPGERDDRQRLRLRLAGRHQGDRPEGGLGQVLGPGRGRPDRVEAPLAR